MNLFDLAFSLYRSFKIDIISEYQVTAKGTGKWNQVKVTKRMMWIESYIAYGAMSTILYTHTYVKIILIIERSKEVCAY